MSPTTENSSFSAISEPSRITHVRYVGLGVADFESGLGFYRDEWGLAPETEQDDLVFLAAEGSPDPFALRLRKTDANRLDLVSFAVPNVGDVDMYAERLITGGIQILSPPGNLDAPGGGYGFRFLDPVEGRTLEIASGWTSRAPRSLSPGEHVPVGVSHIVMNSTRMSELVDFFRDFLGFYESDYLEDQMVFLKGSTPAHHHFAVSANIHANVNHIAYETRGIDEYMRAAGSMLRRGHDMVWGPGRHGPGDNTFAYFQDPNGFVAEYTAEMQTIEDLAAWEPRVWRRVPEQSDQWGTACIRNPKPFIGHPDPGMWNAPPV